MNKPMYYALLCCILFLSGNMHAQSPVDFTKIDQSRITSDDAVAWRQFGPGGSGNNYYLFWHPTDAKTLFQGPNMINAYRSVNQGKTYKGVLDYDGPGYKSDERGPAEMTTPDFSYQNPNFGLCSREGKSFIFKTTDKGASWTREDVMSANFDGQLLNTIEVDPTDDKIWYVGSGTIRDCNHYFHSNEKPHGFSSSPAAANHIGKIWKTTNKGDSWTEITPSGMNSDAQITRIFVHPGNHNIVFAATTYGLYKSTNGGSSWTVDLNSGLDNNIIRSMDMHYNEATGKVTLYAIDLVKYIPNGNTVTYNGGVFKSTNKGTSWQKINNNMPLPKSIISDYAVNKLYYKLALGKWFDLSESQAKVAYPELPESALHSVSMIRVNPKDPNKIIVLNNYKSQFTFSGGMMWRSDNAGADWFVTFRNGKHWQDKHKTIWEGRDNPISHNVSFRAQHEWELRDNYDRKAGATVEFNSDGTKIMFQVAKVVCISGNGGDNWIENDEEDASNDGSEHWVGAGNSNMPGADIVQDPRLDHIYFCSGENSIFRTTPDGENVRENAQAVYKINIPNKAAPQECSVSSVVIDPNDVNTMYSVHFRQKYQGQLMKTTDGGTNWVEHGKILDFPVDDANAKIHQSSLIIDKDDTDVFYVCVPSKPVDDIVKVDIGDITDPFGVYKSNDGGVTFAQINDGFENVANDKLNVLKMRMDPTESGVLYAAVAGASGGLYKLNKGSTTWIKVNTPSGVTDVNDLYFTTSKLYISCGSAGNTNADIGGVFVSEDKGTTWEHIFKSRNANHIRVAAYDEKVLMMSVPSANMTNPGVYRSLNSGDSWTKLNVGNPQSDRLADLEIDLKERGVYWATTYGAGFYKGIDTELRDSDVSVTSVSLPSSVLTIRVGEEHSFVPTVLPQNASDTSVSWKTNNVDKATISDEGVLTALESGQVTVTVTTSDGLLKAKCYVTVIESSQVSNIEAPISVTQGEEVQISVDYIATEEIDVYYRLVQVSPWAVVSESVVEGVSVGVGNIRSSLTVPEEANSQEHRWLVRLTPAGTSWSERISQLQLDAEVTQNTSRFVAIQNVGGSKYVAFDTASLEISCTSKTVGETEKFEWIDLGQGKVALKGSNGKYVSSENGTKIATCNRGTIGAWETFTIVDHGNDIVSFKANNDLHTGASMIFEKTNTGAWQQFKITSVNSTSAKSLSNESIEADEFDISFFPNPVLNGKMTIDLLGLHQKADLILIDSSGQIVLTHVLEAESNEILLDHLSKGFYIMKIVHDNAVYNQKVIIK